MNSSRLNNLKPALQQTQCYVQPGVQLHNEDCLETLKRIETGSIDLMLTDPPYGTTQCDWDNAPNLPLIWQEWERILKHNGVWLIFCNEPFTSSLITSRLGLFKYKWIWCKEAASGFLNSAKMPLMGFEEIVVFSRAKMGNHTYNPQITQKAKNMVRPRHFGNEITSDTYGKRRHTNKETDPNKAYPINVLRIGKNEAECNSLVRWHPTQKPFSLIRYLLKTYSNESETVFDGYSGSGTTAAACIKEKRNFIGSEMNKDYFDMSVQRLSEMIMQPELF